MARLLFVSFVGPVRGPDRYGRMKPNDPDELPAFGVHTRIIGLPKGSLEGYIQGSALHYMTIRCPDRLASSQRFLAPWAEYGTTMDPGSQPKEEADGLFQTRAK